MDCFRFEYSKVAFKSGGAMSLVDKEVHTWLQDPNDDIMPEEGPLLLINCFPVTYPVLAPIPVRRSNFLYIFNLPLLVAC
jgi:hypothetical protein